MAHTQDKWKKTIDNHRWLKVNGEKISNAEKYATHIENMLRKEHEIPLRTHYVVNADGRTGYEKSRILNSNGTSTYKQTIRSTQLTTRIIDGTPAVSAVQIITKKIHYSY